jgi:hypothetical protein
MRNTTDMRRARLGVLVTAMVLGGAGVASAMPETPLAPGWQAFAGCWEVVEAPGTMVPDSARAPLVCIVPVEGTAAVEMVSVLDGRVVDRERVDATGTAYPVRKDDCAGTQSAAWSTVGQRLYVRSDLTCAGGLRRTSSGVLSMTSVDTWSDVQTITVGANKATRVLRYREAPRSAAIPAEITAAIGSRSFSYTAARVAAV